MKSKLSSAAAGAMFGTGLVIAGMTQPSKVIGFLDVLGSWDPSLAFVMIGGIAVHFILMRLVLRRPAPIFAEKFHLPTRRDLDARLIGGAALFGVGWGLGGYCPGPALVSAASGAIAPVAFVIAMTAGMLFHRFQVKVTTPEAAASS
ncbi:MAG: DUF6691 family protein [Polyangiales bacterium]